MKRLVDFLIAATALVVLSPVIALVALLIWLEDFHSPFYVAPRIGLNGKPFRMVKFRSMIVNADRTGVTSTSSTDRRITRMGSIVRRYKLDEIMQLWNVFKGDMSLVGPRPNVPSGVEVYTSEERKLLNVRPGITDFASIVFADEGEILKGHADADAAYDQLIRPYKSALGLHYIRATTLPLDVSLIVLTVVAIVSRKTALDAVAVLLQRSNADSSLIDVARRSKPLVPSLPPGALAPELPGEA
jgi:lipopolysaccharide/colanic/teichoic acid biosynthesis glycosyltransferase